MSAGGEGVHCFLDAGGRLVPLRALPDALRRPLEKAKAAVVSGASTGAPKASEPADGLKTRRIELSNSLI